VQYIHSDLGQRKRGDVVEVQLQGSAANVVLLDSSNFSAFKNGRQHRYYGGLAKNSPVHLTVPHSGHWYAVVYIPAGYRGSVRAGFRLLPGALPALRQTSASALGAIRQAADEYAEEIEGAPEPQAKAYDVFISHASEDKDEVVRPLAHALLELGVSVWYDEFVLGIGDKLRRKIDAGLRQSRFGVVVLSPAFFSKGWPQYELDGLVTREVAGGGQVILPIWHKVGQAEVMDYSPSLAGTLARSTGSVSIEDLAAEIAEVTRREEKAA
jgi:hypothetical protein